MDLNIIDIVILIVVLATAVWGGFKGFVAQIAGILALIVGVWCAFKLSGYFAQEIKELFSLSMAVISIKVILFIIFLIIAIFLGKILGEGIEGLVKITMMDWLNRLLGVIFAALQVIMVLSIFVYLLDNINDSWQIFSRDTLNKSQSYQFLHHFATKIFPYLKGMF
jgi:membrane protein required for colicin V production